jgi:uncharacterized spore protein YtfJ
VTGLSTLPIPDDVNGGWRRYRLEREELIGMTQTVNDTTVLERIREAVDGASASRVFGTPIVRDGLTVLPVAKIGGGGGGGSGTGPAVDGQETGGAGGGFGGGFGVTAKPLGVFVIKDGTVRWRPAIDVNKVILGGQLVAVTALLVVRAIIKARAARP